MCEQSSIIYILTDDMGHGDISCLNENSEMTIPNALRAMALLLIGAHVYYI